MQQTICISRKNSHSLTLDETHAFCRQLEKGEIIVTGFECLLGVCFADLQDVEVFRTYFDNAGYPPNQIVIPNDYTEGVKAIWELPFPITVRSEKDLINLYYDIEYILNVDEYYDLNVTLHLVLHRVKDSFSCKPYYVKALPTDCSSDGTDEKNYNKTTIKMIEEIHINDTPSEHSDIWLHHIITFLGRLDRQPVSVQADSNKFILTWDLKNKKYADQLYSYLVLQAEKQRSVD